MDGWINKIENLQKSLVLGGWVGGWMGGWVGGSKSRFKDCLQQSKITFIMAYFRKHLQKMHKFPVPLHTGQSLGTKQRNTGFDSRL